MDQRLIGGIAAAVGRVLLVLSTLTEPLGI